MTYRMCRQGLSTLLVLLTLSGAAVSAQVRDTTVLDIGNEDVRLRDTADVHHRPGTTRLVTIGSASEDRLRVQQLLGAEPTAGFLLRSPSALTPALGVAHAPQWEVFTPELRGVWNSAIPFSANDGALWAGRGTNFQLLAGGRVRFGPVSLTVAPEYARSENRDFEILPEHLYRRIPGRSPFASIWHVNDGRIDMPYRFGDDAFSTWSWGQSTLAIDAGPVVVGLATENQWWGPGIRNAIVLSNNAPGFLHFHVRTDSPLRTEIGAFEAKWLVGELRESDYFNTNPSNGGRSLSAAVLTYSPRWEPGLTLGAARGVYANANNRQRVIKNGFHVFTSWERRDSVMQVEWEPATEQVLSLFGRWVLPEEGFELYGEYARQELPVSLRDLLLAPHHTRGYTLGFQWARPFSAELLRLQGEITQLEQSPTFRQRPGDTFYTGRSWHHGYTHRGQILGAAIGPGSSSQWLSVDWLHDRGQIGLFGGRIRWESDALYSSPSPRPERGFRRTAHAHDVSVFAGIRAGYAVAGMELLAEYSAALRYNYLFQNPDIFFGPEGAVDVRNRTFRVEMTPSRPLRLVR
ncbi:hypothetical protein BH23GEM3_BH23GEM3_00780 [soil metagenome]